MGRLESARLLRKEVAADSLKVLDPKDKEGLSRREEERHRRRPAGARHRPGRDRDRRYGGPFQERGAGKDRAVEDAPGGITGSTFRGTRTQPSRRGPGDGHGRQGWRDQESLPWARSKWRAANKFQIPDGGRTGPRFSLARP